MIYITIKINVTHLYLTSTQSLFMLTGKIGWLPRTLFVVQWYSAILKLRTPLQAPCTTQSSFGMSLLKHFKGLRFRVLGVSRRFAVPSRCGLQSMLSNHCVRARRNKSSCSAATNVHWTTPFSKMTHEGSCLWLLLKHNRAALSLFALQTGLGIFPSHLVHIHRSLPGAITVINSCEWFISISSTN